jgi:hypothetical protein
MSRSSVNLPSLLLLLCAVGVVGKAEPALPNDEAFVLPKSRKAAAMAVVTDADGSEQAIWTTGKSKRSLGSPWNNDVWSLRVFATDFTWERLHAGGDSEDAPVPRWKSAADTINNEVFLFGGSANENAGLQNDIWKFSVLTGKWEHVDDLVGAVPEHRRAMGVNAVDDTLWIFAGKINLHVNTNDLWHVNLNGSKNSDFRPGVNGSGTNRSWVLETCPTGLKANGTTNAPRPPGLPTVSPAAGGGRRLQRSERLLYPGNDHDDDAAGHVGPEGADDDGDSVDPYNHCSSTSTYPTPGIRGVATAIVPQVTVTHGTAWDPALNQTVVTTQTETRNFYVVFGGRFSSTQYSKVGHTNRAKQSLTRCCVTH